MRCSADAKQSKVAWRTALGSALFYLFIALTSLSLILTLWIHQPFGRLCTYLLLALWLLLACSVLGVHLFKKLISRRLAVWLYVLSYAIAVAIYISLPARNDRPWQAEVARILSYQQKGRLVRVDNVRNFNWRSETDYDVRWESRNYDLSKLQALDLILSYWSMPQIAHTLVSFRFSDGQILTFSIETRKEQGEHFSNLGGFFRKYELAFVAADEKDIVYTRSNIRHEQVYIYPINNRDIDLQALFLSYLEQAQALHQQPRWYNTLLSNCTTVVFEMVNDIQPVPADYRILLSGLLPSYFYEHQTLDPRYSLAAWQQMAHINPKVAKFNQLADQSSAQYSQLIRSGWPTN